MSGLRSWTGREFHRRGPAAGSDSPCQQCPFSHRLVGGDAQLVEVIARWCSGPSWVRDDDDDDYGDSGCYSWGYYSSSGPNVPQFCYTGHSVFSRATRTFLTNFTFNRLCMKLFKTGSIDVAKDCQSFFAIDLSSCVLKRRQYKFVLRYKNFYSQFFQFCSFLLLLSLFMLQLVWWIKTNIGVMIRLQG